MCPVCLVGGFLPPVIFRYGVSSYQRKDGQGNYGWFQGAQNTRWVRTEELLMELRTRNGQWMGGESQRAQDGDGEKRCVSETRILQVQMSEGRKLLEVTKLRAGVSVRPGK